MKFYDVTYRITHHRPFKAPSEEWLRKFCEENDMEIIEYHELCDEENL
jgi:hypothetical protein